ncbi:MAG: hypothetical protein JWN18_598 [Parcubacteria group bacterium]|nr:hypothetical protein [Parcubacteria group bacterium]
MQNGASFVVSVPDGCDPSQLAALKRAYAGILGAASAESSRVEVKPVMLDSSRSWADRVMRPGACSRTVAEIEHLIEDLGRHDSGLRALAESKVFTSEERSKSPMLCAMCTALEQLALYKAEIARGLRTEDSIAYADG